MVMMVMCCWLFDSPSHSFVCSIEWINFLPNDLLPLVYCCAVDVVLPFDVCSVDLPFCSLFVLSSHRHTLPLFFTPRAFTTSNAIRCHAVAPTSLLPTSHHKRLMLLSLVNFLLWHVTSSRFVCVLFPLSLVSFYDDDDMCISLALSFLFLHGLAWLSEILKLVQQTPYMHIYIHTHIHTHTPGFLHIIRICTQYLPSSLASIPPLY